MSEELARKIKAARAKLGLSQSQAAEAWGIPVRTLQKWEIDESTPRGFALASLNQKLDKILSGGEPAAKPAAKRTRKKAGS